MSETALEDPSTAAVTEEPILAIRDLYAGYGESQVLHGISLHVKPREVVTLIGRNGAGKTTTLRSIIGIIGKRRGSIVVRGVETIAMASRLIARLGLGYVPEERGIFSALSVRENLYLPPVIAPNGLSVEEIFTLFPNLRERLDSRGTKLSGGEQQMLAIARVLRTGSRLLLLDEPTEGLAPVIVQQIGRTIEKLKVAGFTIVLVEQNIHFAVTISDRHYVYEEGNIVDMVPNSEVVANLSRLQSYLGV